MALTSTSGSGTTAAAAGAAYSDGEAAGLLYGMAGDTVRRFVGSRRRIPFAPQQRHAILNGPDVTKQTHYGGIFDRRGRILCGCATRRESLCGGHS
jgi:hypothetical protein